MIGGDDEYTLALSPRKRLRADRGQGGLSDRERDSLAYIHKTHPELSPAQLHAWIKKRYSSRYRIPGAALIARALEDRGYVPPVGRKGRPKSRVRGVTRPNEMWCSELGEPVLLGDKTQAAPFAIVDAFTGYVLRLEAVDDPWSLQPDNAFRSAYKQYGQPGVVRTPMDIPFVVNEPGFVTDLAVWLVRTGVKLDRRGRQPFVRVDVSDLTAAADASELQRLYDARRKELNLQPGPDTYVKSETPHYRYLIAPEEHVWGHDVMADKDGRISFRGRKLKIATSVRRDRVTVVPWDFKRDLHEVRMGPVRYGLIDGKDLGRGLIPGPFQGVLSMRPDEPTEELDWLEVLGRK